MQRAVDFVKTRPRTSALYGGFIIASALVYRSLKAKEGGQYDYLLTLSAGLQALAFAFLACDTRGQVSDGLSVKTLWAFLAAHVTRTSTTFWGSGYVPEDSTGDFYLYQAMETLSVLLIAWKILNIRTVRGVHDVGQGFDSTQVLLGMMAVSLCLASLTKSTGHNDYFADLSWMFSVWLDAIALTPQVRLLMAANHVDENVLHFALVTSAASLVFAVFWWKGAVDKGDELMKEGYHAFLFGIVGASAIRMALCSVYLYLFLRTARTFAGDNKKGEYELCVQEEEL